MLQRETAKPMEQALRAANLHRTATFLAQQSRTKYVVYSIVSTVRGHLQLAVIEPVKGHRCRPVDLEPTQSTKRLFCRDTGPRLRSVDYDRFSLPMFTAAEARRGENCA